MSKVLDDLLDGWDNQMPECGDKLLLQLIHNMTSMSSSA